MRQLTPLSPMVNPVTCIFHFFEALDDDFEVQIFSGLFFCTISKTLIACKAMQLRVF